MDIQKIVKKEIFPILGEGKFEEAEKKLRRLMLTLTENNDTEDHRMVLCSLSRIKYMTGDIDNAKYYINRFTEVLKYDAEYKGNNKNGYCNYLNLYAEIFKDSIDIDEKIKINNINLDNAINNNDTARIYTAKANIAFLTDDIEEIEDVLMDIHNYEKSILIDENKLIDTEVLKDLCNLKIEIYKELKEKYPDYVQEDYNCVY